ncbi:STAS domain-containing protein [Desulfonatronovibrio hydrogenovorans]|uniref:STAS domain-containing protein n=1 Tax=Desulfonatronovibrio hydrogenovorans TaxID=53245 RepID=UPI000491D8D7|nr:STAS domain-containing protein [Desulfonatronovibrio hydrogenovorans]
MERVRLINEDGLVKIFVEGEITLEIIAELKTLFNNVFMRDWHSLVVDLSGVRFMDSSGIGFLTAMNNRACQMNRGFVLENPSDQVLKTLKLVNLADYFRIVRSEC